MSPASAACRTAAGRCSRCASVSRRRRSSSCSSRCRRPRSCWPRWSCSQTVALGTFWAPAMAMLSDAADSHGMSQSYALALVNFAWAAGQIVGAGGGGALAKAAGDAVPFALSAALCAATLALILVRSERGRSGWSR